MPRNKIMAVLKEGETDVSVADLCCKSGMSDAAYYNWMAKCGPVARSLGVGLNAYVAKMAGPASRR